jgi:hypothetical protein
MTTSFIHSARSTAVSGAVFFLRILDNGPTGYYVLELEAPVATLICLVDFLLAILEKIKDRIWLFSSWAGGVFGYFKL